MLGPANRQVVFVPRQSDDRPNYRSSGPLVKIRLTSTHLNNTSNSTVNVNGGVCSYFDRTSFQPQGVAETWILCGRSVRGATFLANDKICPGLRFQTHRTPCFPLFQFQNINIFL